jgi:hypothetical protein
MPWFTIVKVFEIFLAFLFKIFAFIFSLFKDSAVLPVYGVGISFFLLLKIAVLSRVLLFFSAKVIVQAVDYTN